MTRVVEGAARSTARFFQWMRRHPPVIIVFLILLAVWDQSYVGRLQVVSHNRIGCERNSQDKAVLINDTRLDLNANLAVSRDPRQPATTRRARLLEAQGQAKNLLVLDSHVDRGDWSLLQFPVDRRVVRDGQWRHEKGSLVYVRPFRCDVANASGSPFSFGP